MKDRRDYRRQLLERISANQQTQNLKSSKGSSIQTQCTPNQQRDISTPNLVDIFQRFDNNFYVFNEPVKFVHNYNLKRPLVDDLIKLSIGERQKSSVKRRILTEVPQANPYELKYQSRKNSSRCITVERQETGKAQQKQKPRMLSRYRSLKVIPCIQQVKMISNPASKRSSNPYEQFQLKRANSSKGLNVESKNKYSIQQNKYSIEQNKYSIQHKGNGKSIYIQKIGKY